MWKCDFGHCNRPSVRQEGGCILCDRHLCAKHLVPEFHKCPKWEDEKNYHPAAGKAEQHEINTLLEKINIPALLSRASKLRNGIACSVPHNLQYDRSTSSKVMGGMNYHIEVQFEDGVSWLARIRRFNATSPPAGLRNYIMRSEVATLQFLSRTNVPSPKVFDFDLDESNPIGVSYILMEKMSGRTVGTSLSKASRAEQRMKVLDQLADIYIDLSAYPFDVMGSLDQTGTTHVGAFAHESLTDFRDSQMKPTGPCSSIQEYCTESIHLILDLIMRQEIYTSRPVDAFLIHLFLLDVVPKVFSSTDLDDGRFYMRHADDKGDHILIDDDYNITAIIDWEWAYTAPKPVAFNSPIGLLPVNDFYNGDNDIGKDEVAFAQLLEEKGRSDLGKIVRNGRLIHRFNFYCAYDLGDWDGFLGLFFGLLKGLGYEGDLDWETWKGEALKRYREDDRLQQLIGVTRSD